LIPDPKHALHCITFSALREHKTKVCNDIQKTPECDCAALREVGVAAILVLPLFYNNNIRGLLTIISSSSNALDDEEIRLLEELANNLAYGISSLRTRAEHKQHTLLLRQSLEQSIQAIASTLEARDPYTAGHQRRVAELSVAIATEMGLSPDGIEGIRFAAMIHDLGKIHIPAEILSKPGELSDIEYMLIQTHPQEGNNILKEITFPWPIADIILQHHERLDGSGYPRELRGDQILPEAKIICVADVVEAMSSHRPYRPGMGIEAALEEIRRGRGSIYDPDVVDACLKLFDEKGFAFNSVSRTP
jgi:putative nucleotidyltransferase with HDIG domain